MLAGKQAALPVAEVAIAVVRRAAEDADFSGVFKPSKHAVVGNVAEKEIAAIAKPDRAFGPAGASVKSLDGRVADLVFSKSRVNDFDGGIGVEDGNFLGLLGGTREWIKR